MKPKPCPFCGCNQIYLERESSTAYHAMCMDCGARTKPFELPAEWPAEIPMGADEEGLSPLVEHLKKQAAEAWNKRK